MKFLFQVSLLSLVVSCGGDKKSSSTSEMFTNFIQIQRSIPRGQEILGTTQMTNNYIDTSEDGARWVVKQSNYTAQSQSIVLKVEGELLYKLEEFSSEGNITSRSISISLLPTFADLARGPITGRIENGYYVDSSTDVQEAVETENVTLGKAIMQMTDVNNIRVNLGSACEMSLSSTSSGTLTANGEVTATPVGSTEFGTTCGGVLTATELKALDLSDIEVCDETTEEYKCEENKNMESLTNDL